MAAYPIDLYRSPPEFAGAITTNRSVLPFKPTINDQ